MLLIADTSPLISLILIKKFDVLEAVFPNYIIPAAVWNELMKHNEIRAFEKELTILSKKVRTIKNYFPLSGIDKGETEAIILYKELKADFLLIDDKRARQTAEAMDINCIGALAVLYKAKQKKLIKELYPVFLQLVSMKRFYSKNYLNFFLSKVNETKL
jgi:predicted nucleic acid-binding protein